MSSNFKYRITFVAISKTLEMELSANQPLIGEFAIQFSKDVDYENKKIAINPLQQNTEELKENFKNFVDHYKDKEPKLNQLNSYFKSLKENENFYLVVNHIVDSKMHLELFNRLTSLEQGESYELVKQRMDDLFKDLLLVYDAKTYNKDTKRSIGEIDKSKRVCRFCAKKSPDVKFVGVAHAISEALGNKKIILNEECDDCNNKFGSQVEIDLITYLRFYSIFYGIKGKQKIPSLPKIDGRNFDAKYEEGLVLEYHQSDDNESLGEDFPLKLNLNTNEFVTMQNVYKTLCKYALSVVDSELIPVFKNTIDWINSNISLEKLPKVAVLVTNSFFDKHPQLTIYIRKDNNQDLPFAVAEFRFTAFTYVFIIPLCSKDKKNFLAQKDYDSFWNTFKHYSKDNGWSYLDLSDNKKRNLTIKLNIDSPKENL